MLRTLVLLLLLANCAYFAWSQGMLEGLGLGPTQQREPQRIATQISAESVQVLSPQEAKRVEAEFAAQATRKECLSAGPFTAVEAEQLEQRLRALFPPNGFIMASTTEPAQWMVYMGPYGSADLTAKKQAELRGLGVKSEPIHVGVGQFGLALGRAASQQEAQAKLQALAPRGVRTAKLVQEKAETVVRTLRLPAADETQRRRLSEALASLPDPKAPRLC